MCDRLIELIKQADDKCGHTSCGECGRFGTEDDCLIGLIADYLIENGVIVPPHKPINVMRIEDSTDVCCPYCETILSGLYGEEPTDIIQCYICGAFLDNTGAITREEAEQALKGGDK